MTKPRLTEDELTRLRILVSYEAYQVLRNHDIDDVGRTCIELAERAVEAFAAWLPGDDVEEIKWVWQDDGRYEADTKCGRFVLTNFCLDGRHVYSAGKAGETRPQIFHCASWDEAVKVAGDWIKREYGKG